MRRSSSALLSLLMLAVCATLTTASDLSLSYIFSDHMVLQRDKPVAVWGWSDAGSKGSVEFAGQSKSFVADSEGKWSVKLDPMPASKEPRVLKVVSGNSSQEVKDVLVGEVWLGSGQSNMAMTVNRAKDFETEQLKANLPLVRMFREGSSTATSPQANGKGAWTVCSPDTVAGFSATLYFFGRPLHLELDVPVGLINSSVGGTPIESWIAADVQRSAPELKAFFADQAKEAAAFDEKAVREQYARQLVAWEKARAAAKADKKPLPAKPRDPIETRNRKADIGGLYHGKIAPLAPYTLRGMLWYQGEANAQPGKSIHYHHQLALLIKDWRKQWGEEVPFAWVQLPNFGRPGEYWMEVREGMLKTLEVPKTGMAITIDIGDEKDIHPKNKQDVGKRLALWALGEVYGEKVPSTSGPLPAQHQILGNAVKVEFKHADGGLKAKEGTLKGFEVLGADGNWKTATATIDGSAVVISSPDEVKPTAARYSWAPYPDGNLVNGFELPASPFRTNAN